MKSLQIRKLYLSNFLTGLVFWYGIEKLFMGSIGIDAVGIAAATAALTIFLMVFDIPAGILADKWSRKGVLLVSAVALGVCSLILGVSHGLVLYIAGDLVYGLYLVASNGTYQAIIYDSLHEEGRAGDYSRINGMAYALFMVGAGVGNVASGFIAHHYGFRASYFVTVIPCVLNALVIVSLLEPKFHKAAAENRIIRQLGSATRTLFSIKLLRILTLLVTIFAVVELFKLEFAQLYFLRYISAPQAIGLLWAVYAFAMALGSVIAHRLRARLNILIYGATVPYVIMAFVDNWFAIVLFMVQAVAAAALLNQIETRIQEETPSAVRASVLSVVSTLGRAVMVPASFLLGYLFREYSAFWALRFVATITGLALLYWLIASRGVPHANDPAVAESELPNPVVLGS